MDEDRRELANRLFAAATGILEDAAEIAASGQSAARSLGELVDIGRALNTGAHEIAVLAEAAVIVSAGRDDRPDPATGQNQPTG